MASDTYGAILLTTANDVGAMLQKKMATPLETYAPAVWANTINLLGKLPEKTVSFSPIVTFSDGADAVPLKSCEVALPASLDGYSSVDVVGTGRNLVALNVSPQQAKRDFGITVNTQTADTLNVTTTGVAYACERLFYSFKKGTYSVKFLATSSDSFTPFISIYRTNGTGVKFNIQPNTITTFTLADDADIDIRLFASGSGDTTVRTVEFSYLQIEAGSTATAYTEYVALTTYTANLGRTIHGGTVDVVKGEGADENGNDFTFEPVEINSRLGDNTMWSDGDMEVTYRADIDIALQSLSGLRGLMMARPQLEPETEETEPEDETTETIEETPEDMEK